MTLDPQPAGTRSWLPGGRLGRVLRSPVTGGVVLGLVLLLAVLAAVGPRLFASNAPPPIGGPFALVDGTGRPVTDATYRGRWMLVYFGYTHCPDACPTALNDIANALDLLGSRAREVAPIFITVDPARDTPKVMAEYAGAFGTRITGLTGTAAQVAAVEAEYKVYAVKHPEKDGDYAMDHTDIVYLMDPAGRFVTIFGGSTSAQEMARRLGEAVTS